MAYLDPQTNLLKPELYTWDDTNDSSANWANASTWEDWLGTYSATAGVPDLVFTTEIIDFGRLTHVNPLCTVVSSGTHNIKVFSAEQIDSSSQLPGDPVIDTSDSTTAIPGVYGRYFQFRIEVFDGADSFIRSVTTDLNGQEQLEFIQGDSDTHEGTSTTRILPITKNFSKLVTLTGNASLPSYGIDSSTTQNIVIKDLVADYPISTTGNTQAVQTEFKWQPASIQFNNPGDSSADTNDTLSIDMSGLGVGTSSFNIEFWWKPKFMDNLGQRFFTMYSSGEEFSVEAFSRVGASGQNQVHFRLFKDNQTIEDYADDSSSAPADLSALTNTNFNEDIWYWIQIGKSVGTANGDTTETLNFQVNGENGGSQFATWFGTEDDIFGDSARTFDFDLDNFIMRIGDVGGGQFIGHIDDLRISSPDRYFGSSDGGSNNSFPPTAEFTQLADTKLLVQGNEAIDATAVNVPIVVPGNLDEPTQPRYAVINANGDYINATVHIQVSGLPKMIINAAGNIVEQA